METAFKTDCGKIRSHNEDSGGVFSSDDGVFLAVVADGMGGHSAGEVASALAVKHIKERWAAAGNFGTGEAAEKWLQETIAETNTNVLAYAREHPECQGMGTTVVAAFCAPEFVTMAHVGDSRGYLFGKNGLTQITKDHSLVGELVRRGELSEEEAAFHPRKHVLLQALGTEETIDSEVRTVEWQAGDIVLLCSDGLTDNLSREQLEEVMKSEQTVREKADKLTEIANLAGGDDNITSTLVQLCHKENSVPKYHEANDAGTASDTGNGEALLKEERNG
ncbi:MAG TPA: Stp1/IreP family PP2C-type Ser/Thr phosphatase [Bacillales bacterium]|nr:Stp1/IreP family PP2C-type Ser/Thr phosphatase [Bacillales bacterium]